MKTNSFPDQYSDQVKTPKLAIKFVYTNLDYYIVVKSRLDRSDHFYVQNMFFMENLKH